MPRTREQELPALSRTDLLGGENQAIQRLIGAQAQTHLANVHVADMDPNPFNPRQAIEVSELVESMREHGFIGALDGRLQGRRVQLAYGARRLAAAKIAGIEQIPVYLHADWDDNILLTISLVENVQREDLSPLETALTVQQMNERLGWSQRDIARRTGKSHSWVRDMIALAAAGSDVQALVRERPDAARHARFIAQVEDEAARQALAQAARRDDLTADQVYRAVQAVKSGQTAPQALRSVMRRSPAPRRAGARSTYRCSGRCATARDGSAAGRRPRTQSRRSPGSGNAAPRNPFRGPRRPFTGVASGACIFDTAQPRYAASGGPG